MFVCFTIIKGKKEQNADSALLSGLTRRQLKELEEKERPPRKSSGRQS